MKFGENLRLLRTRQGFTQEELARKVGIQKQNISRYENSDREPNIKTARRLAEALGVTLEELTLGDTGLTALHDAEAKADALNILPGVFAGWDPDPEDGASAPTESCVELLTRINNFGPYQDEICKRLLLALEHHYSLPIEPSEVQLITDYRSLTPPGKEYIRQTMAMALMSYSEKNDPLSDVEEAD